MAQIEFRGRRVTLAAGESVLEGLERAGLGPASGCRAGICGACLVRASEGVAPPEAQRGLAPVLVSRGAFFACMARPGADLVLDELDGALELAARIAALEPIGRDVLRVQLTPERPFDYTPGQYAVLLGPEGVERSYSLASLPADGALELHVRRVPGGAMTGWLFERARVGAALRVRGPLGTCCYAPGRPDQALILVGAGTGLAPLVGILRDALQQGHRGPIELYQGARDEGGLYHRGELARLAHAADTVRIHACVLAGPVADPAVRVQGLAEAVLADRADLTGARLFLCGDGALVRALRRRFFLAGAASADLLVDPFEIKPQAASVHRA